MMRGLFLCFALASILNVFFIFDGSQVVVEYGSMGKVSIGYPGYFLGKNYLGECAAVAIFLSVHEMLYPGLRRTLGAIVIVIATLLLFLSGSKTALGLAVIAPFLAGVILIARKKLRISPALILLSIPFCYAVLSSIYELQHESRIIHAIRRSQPSTGRTIIWDFVHYEIARQAAFRMGIPILLARRTRRAHHR